MATVHEDVIDGCSATRTKSGLEATRVFLVSGLTGNDAEIILNALDANGIPQRLDEYPGSSVLFADSLSAEAIGSHQAKVTVSYKELDVEQERQDEEERQNQNNAPLDLPDLSISTTVQSVETTRDYQGKPLDAIYIKGGEKDGEGFRHLGTVNKSVPNSIFSFRRTERESPANKAREYVGKINSDTFQSDPPHFWLCTGIDAQSPDNGKTFSVTYSFQRNDSTWNAAVVFTDSEGKIPDDIEDIPIDDLKRGSTNANGWGVHRIYDAISFSGLGLG